MMKDAEAHAGEDEKRKSAIEARNRLDSLVYSVEKTFSENKDKLDAAASGEIEAAIAESKTALGGEDADAMNNAFERLQTASHKLAEVLYSQAGAEGQPTGEAPTGEQASSASAGADGGASGSDDNVIDAEYVDVDEEKK
jgi:molecular chaperone DnaK